MRRQYEIVWQLDIIIKLRKQCSFKFGILSENKTLIQGVSLQVNTSFIGHVRLGLYFVLRTSDTQKDILLTEKSHYRLICHINESDTYTCIYKIGNLIKSYDNIHSMTYTTKIMLLSGIAKIKTGYFDNIKDYY